MNGVEIALAGYLAFGQLIPQGQQEIVKHAGLQALHADGAVTLRLREEERGKREENGAEVTTIRLVDEHYPFEVTRYVKTWRDCDAVETWMEIRHSEGGPVRLIRADSFASAVGVPAKEVGGSWPDGEMGAGGERQRVEGRERTDRRACVKGGHSRRMGVERGDDGVVWSVGRGVGQCARRRARVDRHHVAAHPPRLGREDDGGLRRRRHDERTLHARPRQGVQDAEGRAGVVREGARRGLAAVPPLGAQPSDAAWPRPAPCPP